MLIAGYGVRLTRLAETHLEMVRNWRNAVGIKQHMEFQEYITEAMQQQWYNRLKPLNDFYFIIEYNEQPIGLIHTSNINWSNYTGQSGLFIANERYIGTHVPVLASLSMVDIMFGLFPLKMMYAKVKNGNASAEEYNAKLGFAQLPNQNKLPFQQYVMTKELYYMTTPTLRRNARILGGSTLQITFSKQLFKALQNQNLIHGENSGINIEFEVGSIPL